jgi:hypothetical protein
VTAFVTDNGLANVVAAWLAYSAAPVNLQCGTGSGRSDFDNDLAQAVQTREGATGSQVTTNVTGDTLRLTATFTATSDLTISEVGLFDGGGSGDPAVGDNMIVYGDFDPISLANGDMINFTVNVTVT